MPNIFKRVSVRIYKVLPAALRMWVVSWLTPNYTAGVVIFLVRANGDVLLQRQTYRKGWVLPGGLVDRHESMSSTVQREVSEELNIKISLPTIYRIAVNERLHTFTAFAAVLVDETQIAGMQLDPVEIAEVRWFPFTELPQLHQDVPSITRQDFEVVQNLLRS